ncbi:MAG: hypothetical protein AABY76_05620, partial [Planctomycetota bacterium]
IYRPFPVVVSFAYAKLLLVIYDLNESKNSDSLPQRARRAQRNNEIITVSPYPERFGRETQGNPRHPRHIERCIELRISNKEF